LGNLLGLFGLKLKSRKDREGKRWYRLNEEVLSDPIRQQVLTCIETKLTQPREKIDWKSAINEAHGIKTENQPQTQTEQGLEVTAPSPNFLYTNQLEGAVNNSTLESQGLNQVSEEVLTDPTRQQVLTCIETKLTQPKEEIDWESAINEAHGIKTENQPQTQTEQGLEVTAPSPNFLYTNQLEGAVNNFNLESHDVEQILEAFEFCQTPDDFAAAVEGYPSELVEDAISLAPDQPRRSQLRQWNKSSPPAIGGRLREVEPAIEENIQSSTQAPSLASQDTQPQRQQLTEVIRPSLKGYQPGQEVWAYFPQSQEKWLKGTVEWVRENLVRVKSGFLGILVESSEAIAPGDWGFST
jgi:hypothetical protein